jgi:uncharacterized damage-inducible protein DinB
MMMSVYTNPTSGAKEDAEAYVRAVLELLGEQDPMAVLQDTPSAVRWLTRGLTRKVLHTPEAEGKWSIAQVLQHLADAELVWGYRMRRMLTEDRPRVRGYDQDLWASRLRYAEADPERALTMFEALRVANLELLEHVTEDDLRRCCVHEERGEETVAHVMRLYAGHDLVHRRQLTRIRAALGEGKEAPARSPGGLAGG